MKRVAIVLGVALALSVAGAHAQTRPNFSGEWQLNAAKSNPTVTGNSPNIPFPSQLVIKQTTDELHLESTSVRQAPFSAIFKLDGSKVTLKAPSGITESGEATMDGANLVITTRRSFTSPLGETVVDFKEVWTLSGSDLTIVKTRVESGESTTEKAVFTKM